MATSGNSQTPAVAQRIAGQSSTCRLRSEKGRRPGSEAQCVQWVVRPRGEGRQGNLLKHGNVELELFYGERSFDCGTIQTRRPDPFGAPVIVIVMVFNGIPQEAFGHVEEYWLGTGPGQGRRHRGA